MTAQNVDFIEDVTTKNLVLQLKILMLLLVLFLAHQNPIIRQTFLLGLMYIAIKQMAKL